MAAEKQHAETPGADRRGQQETRRPVRPDACADDRRSVIEGGSPQNAERPGVEESGHLLARALVGLGRLIGKVNVRSTMTPFRCVLKVALGDLRFLKRKYL